MIFALDMNITDLQPASEPSESSREQIRSIFYGIIFFIGFLGNLWVTYSILRFSIVRKITTNLTFINLSLLIMMPFSINTNLWNKSTHGWILCKFMVLSPNVSFIAHALTLFLMCMEHAFGDVMSKARGYRKHRIKAASITCLCVWVVAFLLSLPPLIYLRYSTVQLPTGGELRVCVDYWPNSVSRAAYTSMKLLLLILTIIGCVLMKTSRTPVQCTDLKQ